MTTMAGPIYLSAATTCPWKKTCAAIWGFRPTPRPCKLFKNMKDGTFQDVTKEAALDKVFMPMGANFGDIDNDGYLDIYLGTGNPSYASLVPNVMLRNHDGKFFADVTASSGTGELHKGHGVAFADIDNDGDEDLLAQIGGATPGDSHPFRLFENPGSDGDWINLHLVGVKSNRAAIGARIKVTVENPQGATALHLSHGRQRRIVRSVAAGAAYRTGKIGAHRRAGNMVADQQHPADFHRGWTRISSLKSRNLPRITRSWTGMPFAWAAPGAAAALPPKWGTDRAAAKVK